MDTCRCGHARYPFHSVAVRTHGKASGNLRCTWYQPKGKPTATLGSGQRCPCRNFVADLSTLPR